MWINKLINPSSRLGARSPGAGGRRHALPSARGKSAGAHCAAEGSWRRKCFRWRQQTRAAPCQPTAIPLLVVFSPVPPEATKQSSPPPRPARAPCGSECRLTFVRPFSAILNLGGAALLCAARGLATAGSARVAGHSGVQRGRADAAPRPSGGQRPRCAAPAARGVLRPPR